MKKLALFAVIAFALVGCGYNYAGDGNEFTFVATVDHVGKRSVIVINIDIEDASGKAAHWFNSKPHQIHNNYNECSFHHSRHRVGDVYTKNGDLITLADLYPGEKVRIIGRIRRNASVCGKNQRIVWRPVYDEIDAQ